MSNSLVDANAVLIEQQAAANEERFQRLSQLYAALSHCNQIILRSTRKADLFDEVCRTAVVFGGMKMAWVGLLDESNAILPVSFYGDGLEYLDSLRVTSNADDTHGQGPAGQAIRTRKPVWNQSFMDDPLTSPWHDEAIRFGWRSVAALPLSQKGRVSGVFMLYSSESGAFDQAARKLLVEMASDIGFALDNIARDQASRKAEEQLRLAAKVFDQSSEGFMIADSERRILKVNKAFSDITGYSEDEVLGQHAAVLSSGHEKQEAHQSMWEAVSSTGYWQGEVLQRKKEGHLYLSRLSISRVLDDNDKTVQYICTFSDITKHKASEERLNWLTHFDALTGLPNRVLLEDRCTHAISMARRSRTELALMFLDIDNFRNINDALGFRVGDDVISSLGRTLTAILREQDTVSRLGGDDFVILLPNTDAEGAAHLAEKLLGIISQSQPVEKLAMNITASIGIAVFPSNGHDLESLSQCAEAAMYRAKNEGRNTFRFFTREIQEKTFRMLQVENALWRALENNQLQLHYQPQVSLEHGQIVGVEALLRWTCPELGSISPSEFIPIAERTGLIAPIGEWVLRTATRQMKTWLSQGRPLEKIAVNLSPLQFRQPRLSDLIINILGEAGLPPQFLELELTESVAMEDPLLAVAVAEELKAHGIRISIDDFGNGHSSLGYLKRFNACKLKIDRSFIRNIPNDPEDMVIVSSIISLAANLGLQTVAEGVETEEQLEFLRTRGCTEVQGFLYSKPVPADEFERLLESGRFPMKATRLQP